VRLIYFDEAGSSKDEIQEPIITVASVLLHGDFETGPVERDAEAIIGTVPEHLRDGFEFHAKELFSGSDKFKGWRKDDRHAALRAFMELIPKYELPVHTIGILKEGFWAAVSHLRAYMNRDANTHAVHEAAFMNCAITVETWFKEFADSERGICIADETKARNVIKSNFRDLRKAPWITEQTARLNHLIDTIYFGDSKESIFLQLADCCAFFVKRTMMGRADAKPFYEIIERKVAPQPLRLLFQRVKEIKARKVINPS
jgi:hypothetical protein